VGRITVYGGPERRRRWSDEERLVILAEAFAPGSCVARVARQHDVSTALLYTWRRKLRRPLEPLAMAAPDGGFVETVIVAEGGAAPGHPDAAVIVVDLPHGCRVSIFGTASTTLAAAVLEVLAR